jgi:hypothetical protein
MALPRFSFSGGATDFFQPNQALFRTTFTPSDKLQSDTYQAEAKAYQDAVEKYNEAIKVNPEVAPALPTPISFTQKDFDQFGVDASRRAQQLQNAKQNAFNAISNPSGFSQHYGIGSLGFGDGGEVPVNFVGTGEFPETEPSVGYRTGPALQDKELPLVAELLADSIPVAGDIKAGIEAADYFNKGEYGNALLSGVGVLPFVPPLVSMTKKFKGLTVDSLKRKPTLQAPENSDTFKELGIVDEGKYWRETNKVSNKPTLEQKAGLKEQALKLESGEISNTNFRNYVDANIPYYFHNSVPIIRSPEEIASALGKKSTETKVSKGIKKTGIIGFNRSIPDGTIVDSRFDVTAYQDYDVYTATIHKAGSDVIGYGQSAVLKNVEFTRKKGFENASLKQAKGDPKSPFIRMKGEWKNHSPEELRTLAVEALEQNKNLPLDQQEWVQVSINPAKGATWVALENTADGVKSVPITSAEEVIQIGKLVLARKPKLQSWDDYYKTASFEGGGEVGEGIGSLSLDNRYREAKVFDLDYVEDAERYNSREELEQLNPYFMVGRYKISPNISGSYNRSSMDIPVNVDDTDVFIKEKYKQGDGNLGFDVDTPNRHGFGANVSGNYFTGSTENPEELQAFGDPAKENYGEGFLPQQYNAYYRTPEGLTISGNYREENPDQEREYGIMLSKQIEFQNVKDLTDRIARLLEKNRP